MGTTDRHDDGRPREWDGPWVCAEGARAGSWSACNGALLRADMGIGSALQCASHRTFHTRHGSIRAAIRTPRGYAGDQSGIPPVEHVHGAVFAKVATVLTRAQEQLADIGGLHGCELRVLVPPALWQQMVNDGCIRGMVYGPAGAIIIEPDDLDCTGGT